MANIWIARVRKQLKLVGCDNDLMKCTYTYKLHEEQQEIQNSVTIMPESKNSTYVLAQASACPGNHGNPG